MKLDRATVLDSRIICLLFQDLYQLCQDKQTDKQKKKKEDKDVDK